jgi:hypothetical protein
MIEEAVSIVRIGNPAFWSKTKETERIVNRMGEILKALTGEKVQCTWCARKEIYKHLKKYLEGHGHL